MEGSAQMHKVVQGECLSSIAEDHGFPDWRMIYDDDANQAFRQQRPNPNVICPDDIITIPPLPTKTLGRATGARHAFRTPRARVLLRIRMQDQKGKPYIKSKY